MRASTIIAAIVALGLAMPAAADPSLGFGLNITFGGAEKPETGLGLRVFSDNKRDEFAASVGVDYMFQSKRVRPTVGAAYLGSNSYIGLDLGYDFNRHSIDYSVGIGLANTKSPAATLAPPPTNDGGPTLTMRPQNNP